MISSFRPLSRDKHVMTKFRMNQQHPDITECTSLFIIFVFGYKADEW